jgi:hypothetical protein
MHFTWYTQRMTRSPNFNGPLWQYTLCNKEDLLICKCLIKHFMWTMLTLHWKKTSPKMPSNSKILDTKMNHCCIGFNTINITCFNLVFTIFSAIDLLTYSSFNIADHCSDYTALNCWIFSKYSTGKDNKWSGHGLICGAIPAFVAGTEIGNLKTRKLVAKPKFQSRTSQIWHAQLL